MCGSSFLLLCCVSMASEESMNDLPASPSLSTNDNFFVVIPLLQLDGWAHSHTYNTLHYITAFGSHVTTPCFILYHLHWL